MLKINCQCINVKHRCLQARERQTIKYFTYKEAGQLFRAFCQYHK